MREFLVNARAKVDLCKGDRLTRAPIDPEVWMNAERAAILSVWMDPGNRGAPRRRRNPHKKTSTRPRMTARGAFPTQVSAIVGYSRDPVLSEDP